MRLIVRGNPCLQAGKETHNFLLNRETINEFDILLNFSFLYEIPALILVPSNLRISNEPDDLLPKMKHSKLSYSTLSSSRNPFTRYGAWFFFLIPPFRVLTLKIWRLCRLLQLLVGERRLSALRSGAVPLVALGFLRCALLLFLVEESPDDVENPLHRSQDMAE